MTVVAAAVVVYLVAGSSSADAAGPTGTVITEQVCTTIKQPIVIDADGQTGLAHIKWSPSSRTVCTEAWVHQGECLTGGFPDADWYLVRRQPPGTRWHRATDRLAGTDTYGTPTAGALGAQPFSTNFQRFLWGEMLIASGDFSMWVVISRSAMEECSSGKIGEHDRLQTTNGHRAACSHRRRCWQTASGSLASSRRRRISSRRTA